MTKYVYEHWYNGKCFYVGSGSYHRAHDLRKTTRNKKWHDFCNDDFKNITVKIIEEFEDPKMALDFEKALTIYHDYILKSPLVNIATGWAASGVLSPLYGVKKSEKHKENLRKNHTDVNGKNNPRAKRIIGIKENGDKHIFNTMKECMEELNVSFPTLLHHIQGKNISRKILKQGWKKLYDID